MDTCLSIYLQNFSGPQGFASRLDQIGVVFLQYHRLMRHWSMCYPSKIFELHYESLVTDQENLTQALLGFCDLPWDESCLAFQNNKRVALTASYNQVREPMHTRSVGRWKLYANHLARLTEVFGDQKKLLW
jgi:hypothetical protein